MCDKKKCDWEKAAQQVRARWTYFAHNPFPNCKPIKIGYDDNKDATLFPVTVFVKNKEACSTAAVNECATYGKAAYPPKWLATWRACGVKGCRTVTAFTLNKTEMQMHCYSTALALSS